MLPSQQVDTILRNRYKLTNIVGHGGMGNVYRAEDLRLPGRLCAIKEIQPDPNDTTEAWAQAQQQFSKRGQYFGPTGIIRICPKCRTFLQRMSAIIW